MAAQRSPKNSTLPLKSLTSMHYGSDSAINNIANDEALENVTKRYKRNINNEYCAQTNPPDDGIKSMFSELKEQIDLRFESLTTSVITLTRQNEEMHKSVQFMSGKYDELLSKINCLVQENTDYKTRIKTLENKLEHFENNIRSTTVEIRNIPKQSNEHKHHLTKIIKDIGSVVGLETTIQDLEIRDIYRSKSEAIIVDFTSVTRKEAMVFTSKKFNKSQRESKEPQLNTAHIKVPGPTKPIFISECLTTKAQRLYYMTRGYVKTKKLAATWTSYGKVYVKKEEGQAPIRIQEESDILKIVM